MKRYILALFVTMTFSYAGLVNGIAIIVNDTPITLYDIDVKMETENISKPDAVGKLIDEILYTQELAKRNIAVDIFDIDAQITKIAQQNNMNLLDFKALVRQQQNYEQFTQRVKQQLIHQKLISKIAKGKLKYIQEEDIKIYYNNNEDMFRIPNTIEVMAYVSSNKQLLNKLKSNPILQDDDILKENIVLKQTELSPQVKYIVNSTKEKEFSVIFANNKKYNMFYIFEKQDITTINYEEIKDQIFNDLMKKREENYLKEYFETLKITANIEILK